MSSISQTKIHGVFIKPLKKVVNERGHLMEIQRQDDALHPGFGQAYVTKTLPGVTKAWYLHRDQIDQHAVLKGAMRLVLFDARADSSTHGIINELILEESKPTLIQIPSGVWHGFQAMGKEELLVLHINSKMHDLDHPDEERRSLDDPSIPFRW